MKFENRRDQNEKKLEKTYFLNCFFLAGPLALNSQVDL